MTRDNTLSSALVTRHFSLLHQRHALGEVVLHYRADFVLYLQITRDFFHRQDFAEFWRIRGIEVGFVLVDG